MYSTVTVVSSDSISLRLRACVVECMLKSGTASNLAVLSCVTRFHNTTESITWCQDGTTQATGRNVVFATATSLKRGASGNKNFVPTSRRLS